jgi:hypothetical protein
MRNKTTGAGRPIPSSETNNNPGSADRTQDSALNRTATIDNAAIQQRYIHRLTAYNVLELATKIKSDNRSGFSETGNISTEKFYSNTELLAIAEELYVVMEKNGLWKEKQWTESATEVDLLNYCFSLLKDIEGTDKNIVIIDNEYSAGILIQIHKELRWQEVQYPMSLDFLPWMEVEYPELLKPMLIMIRYLIKHCVSHETGEDMENIIDEQIYYAKSETDPERLDQLLFAKENYIDDGQACEWHQRIREFPDNTKYHFMSKQLRYLQYLKLTQKTTLESLDYAYLMQAWMVEAYKFALKYFGCSFLKLCINPNDTEENHRILADQIIVFLWSSEDHGYHHWFEGIESYYNEYGTIGPIETTTYSKHGMTMVSAPDGFVDDMVKLFEQTCTIFNKELNIKNKYLWNSYFAQALSTKQ